jgi:rubredoxin
MSGGFFSGSFGGDHTKISPATRLECKICWWVYDPAEGDETRQITPGTPFADLPWDWSCPNCSGDKNGFMVLEDQ